MDCIITNINGAKAKRVTRNGRDYLVVPVSLLAPTVLHGSDGPIYYPPDQIKRSTVDWNGIPVVVSHPVNNTGQPVSARDPDISEIGRIYRAVYNSKLRGEAWIDIKDANKVDKRVVSRLEAGKAMEVSTGLFMDKDPAPENATDPMGRPYKLTAKNFRPDHLAVLPDTVGACSIKDGCGLLVNEQGRVNMPLDIDNSTDTEEPTPLQKSFFRWLGDSLGLTANGDGGPSLIDNNIDPVSGLVVNPYSNEHAARVGNPADFKTNSFRRKEITLGVSAIMGKKPGSSTTQIQAYRFDRRKFTAAEAKKWLKEHDIKTRSFEPASGPVENEFDATTLTDNQLSHADLHSKLRELVRQRWPPKVDPLGQVTSYTWIVDVFDKEVVFEKEGKTFSIKYTTDLRTGAVSLSEDDPTEVMRVTTYKPTTNDQKPNDGDTTMALTDQQRQEKRSALVANCNCQHNVPWKGMNQDQVNNLSDDKLEAYDQWRAALATAPVAPPVQNLNPAPNPTPTNPPSDPVPNPPPSPPAPAPSPNPPPPAASKLSMNEFLATMPDEAKAIWDSAVAVRDREKATLVERLTANHHGEAKTWYTNFFMQKDLGELQTLVNALPIQTNNSGQQQQQQPVSNFFGGQGYSPPPVINEEPLSAPVYSYEPKK